MLRSKHFIVALKSVTNGEHLAGLFGSLGIKSCVQLVAYAPSFSSAAVPTDIRLLTDALVAASTATIKFPSDPAKGAKIIRTVLICANSLAAQEVSAAAATALAATTTTTHGLTGGAGPSTTSAAAITSEAFAVIGAKAFKAAESAYTEATLNLDAPKRVKYETVGRLQKGWLDGMPIAIPLGEYPLQLRLGKLQQDQVDLMGKSWVAKESSDRAHVISGFDDMWVYMRRRAQAECVAGCFDVDKAAAARGDPPVAADKRRALSNIQWIAAGKIMSMSAYATPAGCAKEQEAMSDFLSRFPNATHACAPKSDQTRHARAHGTAQPPTRSRASERIRPRCSQPGGQEYRQAGPRTEVLPPSQGAHPRLRDRDRVRKIARAVLGVSAQQPGRRR